MWYLAMTAAQMAGCDKLPEHMGWMACEFSLRNRGLSNLPQALPTGSVLILSDQTPMADHDPGLITDQLAKAAQDFSLSGVLLDLQRQGDYQELIRAVATLPCCVAVTEAYAKDNGCAVFLSPPLNIPLSDAIAPWQTRQIWLDMAVGVQHFTVTEKGCHVSDILPLEDADYPIEVEHLHCRCRREITKDAVRFSLCRGKAQLQGLLKQAQNLGISHAISLYAEAVGDG